MRTNQQITGAYNNYQVDEHGSGNFNDGNLSIVGHVSMFNFYQEECKSNQQFRGFLMEELFNREVE
jgi:hypothetical protein